MRNNSIRKAQLRRKTLAQNLIDMTYIIRVNRIRVIFEIRFANEILSVVDRFDYISPAFFQKTVTAFGKCQVTNF